MATSAYFNSSKMLRRLHEGPLGGHVVNKHRTVTLCLVSDQRHKVPIGVETLRRTTTRFFQVTSFTE